MIVTESTWEEWLEAWEAMNREKEAEARHRVDVAVAWTAVISVLVVYLFRGMA